MSKRTVYRCSKLWYIDYQTMYCKYVDVKTRRTSMSKNTHVNKTKGDGSNRVQNRKQGDIEPCIEPLHFPAECRNMNKNVFDLLLQVLCKVLVICITHLLTHLEGRISDIQKTRLTRDFNFQGILIRIQTLNKQTCELRICQATIQGTVTLLPLQHQHHGDQQTKVVPLKDHLRLITLRRSSNRK